MDQGDKKRDFTRVNDQFGVRLVNQKGSGDALEINSSKSINISGSGLLVNANEKLENGAILNVTFMKPNTFDFFRGIGKVVRVEQDGDDSYKIAINFIDMTPDDMKKLNYYITLRQ
jgi:hypothetical protein